MNKKPEPFDIVLGNMRRLGMHIDPVPMAPSPELSRSMRLGEEVGVRSLREFELPMYLNPRWRNKYHVRPGDHLTLVYVPGGLRLKWGTYILVGREFVDRPEDKREPIEGVDFTFDLKWRPSKDVKNK